MKCAVYIRSNEKANTDMVSISSQIAFFENYINDQGWELYKVYSDVSSALTLKRKGLQNLMADAKNKKFDVILVTDLSRISRNWVIIKQFIDFLKINEIDLVTFDRRLIDVLDNIFAQSAASPKKEDF